MFEFLGLIGVIFVAGLIFLAVSIVLLPFYLLFKLLGFAVKVGFASIFVGFLALLLLPVALVFGVILLFKLMFIAIPLLVVLAIFSWLVGFTRKDASGPIYVEPVPPAQS